MDLLGPWLHAAIIEQEIISIMRRRQYSTWGVGIGLVMVVSGIVGQQARPGSTPHSVAEWIVPLGYLTLLVSFIGRRREFPWRTMGGVLGGSAGIALFMVLFPTADPDDLGTALVSMPFIGAGVLGGVLVGSRFSRSKSRKSAVTTAGDDRRDLEDMRSRLRCTKCQVVYDAATNAHCPNCGSIYAVPT